MASDPCTSIILTDGCGKSPRNSGEGDGRRPRTVPAWRGSSSRRAAAAPVRCRRPSRDPAAAAPVGGAFAAGPDREWCPGLMESGRKSIRGRETGHRGRIAREARTIRPCADDSTLRRRFHNPGSPRSSGIRPVPARRPPRSAGGHSRRSRGPGGDRPAAAAGRPGRSTGCLLSSCRSVNGVQIAGEPTSQCRHGDARNTPSAPGSIIRGHRRPRPSEPSSGPAVSSDRS